MSALSMSGDRGSMVVFEMFGHAPGNACTHPGERNKTKCLNFQLPVTVSRNPTHHPSRNVSCENETGKPGMKPKKQKNENEMSRMDGRKNG